MPENVQSLRSVIGEGLPIFITAINMRAGLVIMSPLYPILKVQYNLSSFQLSFLTSLSVLCFAGSGLIMPLVAKIGSTNRVITFSLAMLSAAIFFRTVGNVSMLFMASLAVGIAIAILNFSLPVWVKENAPDHSGLLTGIYITVMGIFAALSIAVAVPLAEATSWGWRFAMIPWLLIAVASTIWWFAKNTKSAEKKNQASHSTFHRELFKKPGAWSITLFFGFQSMLFYGTATWLPTIFVSKGYSLFHAGLVVSITGLFGSLIGVAVPHYASRFKNIQVLLLILGALITVSFIGMIFDSGWRLVFWLVIVNIGLATTFPLSLMLTVTRSYEASETRSLSIMAQSVGYLMAAISPGIVGAIFDSTNNWGSALIFPAVLGALLGLVGFFAGKSEKIKI